MDQSRVCFDENVMMDFSTSTDYNETDANCDTKLLSPNKNMLNINDRILSPNEKKNTKSRHKSYMNILRNSNSNLRDSVSTIHKIA